MPEEFDTDSGLEDVQPEPENQDTPPVTDQELTGGQDGDGNADKTPEGQDTYDSASDDVDGYVAEERYKNLQSKFTKTSQELSELKKAQVSQPEPKVNKDDFTVGKFEELREENPTEAMEYYADHIKQQTIAEMESRVNEGKLNGIFNSRAENALKTVTDDAKRVELIAEMESVYEIEERDGLRPSPEAAMMLATAGSWDRAISLMNKGMATELGGAKPKTPATPPPGGGALAPEAVLAGEPQLRNLGELFT